MNGPDINANGSKYIAKEDREIKEINRKFIIEIRY
jgi:hypothetical protein